MLLTKISLARIHYDSALGPQIGTASARAPLKRSPTNKPVLTHFAVVFLYAFSLPLYSLMIYRGIVVTSVLLSLRQSKYDLPGLINTSSSFCACQTAWPSTIPPNMRWSGHGARHTELSALLREYDANIPDPGLQTYTTTMHVHQYFWGCT